MPFVDFHYLLFFFKENEGCSNRDFLKLQSSATAADYSPRKLQFSGESLADFFHFFFIFLENQRYFNRGFFKPQKTTTDGDFSGTNLQCSSMPLVNFFYYFYFPRKRKLF